MTLRETLTGAGLLPVVTITDPENAVPIAEALVAGGVPRIEVTLRTPAAFEAMERIAKAVPAMLLGAGTVLNEADLARSADAGAVFAVSPGLTPSLLETALQAPIPLLPGVATASELMLGLEAGLDTFKFFPAETSGGAPALKALGAPFAKARFCPTGGISLQNAATYLALDNVMCVGGSWVVPGPVVAEKGWDRIESLAREASSLQG